MKIGLLSTFPPERCGIAIYSNNLYKHLKKKIKVIRIGTLESDAEYKVNFKSLNLKSIINKIIKKEKIDLLHIQYNAPHFGKYSLNYGLIRLLDLKTPIIVTLHEVAYKPKGSLRDRVLFNIQNKIVNKAKIIVHTPQQKDFLNKKNIYYIPHGLYVNKKKTKISKNILFFGFITPLKGVMNLIKSMQYLRGYKLQIAGKIPESILGSFKGEIIRSIKNKNIILKLGWIDEQGKKKLLNWADIVALPYEWGPYQSGVVHDAISYGIPVLVTRVGSLWETCAIYKFGEIIENNDPKSIAEGIKKIFNNYKSYENGIKEYQKKANWESVAKEHIRLFRSL